MALLIGSLLVLLMATPVLASHVTTPTIGVTQESSGTLVRGKNGGVTVSGYVTCEWDTGVYVWGHVSQPKGRGSQYGFFGTWVNCSAADAANGGTYWSALATTSKGGFGRGAASMSTGAYISVSEPTSEPCDTNDWEHCWYDDWDGTYYHQDTSEAYTGGTITIN